MIPLVLWVPACCCDSHPVQWWVHCMWEWGAAQGGRPPRMESSQLFHFLLGDPRHMSGALCVSL